MGMALGIVLTANKFRVTFWDIEGNVVEAITNKHRNPRSLKKLELPTSIRAEGSIERAAASADILIIAVASVAVRSVAGRIADHLPRNCVVISVAKGLEAESLKTMVDVIVEELPGNFRNQVMALSGPTLAPELAVGAHTAAMLASEKANAYSKRAEVALSCDWLHIYETRDVLGVELAGVGKHAIAIASGIMDGLGMADNTRAWLFTEAFRDISRLIWKLGGQEQTVYSLAGFGDTIGTSFAKGSRNRRFGEYLGKGKTPAQAQEAVRETVEGVPAIEALYTLALREKLRLPVLSALYDVVATKKKAETVFGKLIDELR